MSSSDSDFHAECDELLQEGGRLLLEIQDTLTDGLDPDLVNALFRVMHTIKGLAGLFGRQDISEISHSLESLLDDIRLGKAEMNDDAVGFFLRYNDLLSSLLAATDAPDNPPGIDFLAEIESFRQEQVSGKRNKSLDGIIDEALLKVLTEYEEHRLKTNISDGRGIYKLTPVFGFDSFDTELVELINSIKKHAELISTMPTSEDVPDGSIGFLLMIGSGKSETELSQLLEFTVTTLVAKRDTSLAAPAAKAALPAQKSSTTMVRVDIDKLDRILNTISELTLARHSIKRIWSEMNETSGNARFVNELFQLNQLLSTKIEELQGQVLEIRMIPIGQIYGRLSQVVRRYSREVGKPIEIMLFGEDTELDKYLAEEVMDPMVHLVRNAIDHGLEPPEERIAAGKPKAGSVKLKAFQRGNHVVIEVTDDGRGIDVAHLRAQAIEKGVISPGSDITDREIMELLFLPGFSTRESVSEVSGRGVGLDIVRAKISELGGFVEISTTMGEGTTFSLTLPITLAIIKVLMVRVGTETYGIPLSSVSETMVIEYEDLQSIEDRKVFDLRGELLPVCWLSEVFGITSDQGAKRSFAALVGFGDRRMGILVDELMGQQEVVIKSLSEHLEGTTGLAGAAEVGSQKVVLVLDVEGIIDEGNKQKGLLNV